MAQDDFQFEHETPEEVPRHEYPMGKTRRKRRGRLLLIIGLAVLLLAAGGVGGYWFLKHRAKPSQPATASQTSKQSSGSVPAAQSDGAASGTTTYTSKAEKLNLLFDYLSNWQVSPATAAATTELITITSPSTSVAAADGSSVTGKVVVMIRPGGTQISELTASAAAAQDSTQIGYTHPTATQRQYPFLTFVHFAKAASTGTSGSGAAADSTSPSTATSGTSSTGGFEEVIITGGQQFKKDDVVSSDNLGTIDPLISASFYRCDTTACSGQSPAKLSILLTTWQNATLFRQAEALLTSFKLN